MVSSDAQWLTPHNDIYDRIAQRLRQRPPTDDLHGFLREQVHELLADILNRSIFGAVESARTLTFTTDPVEGQPAVYWDGRRLILRPYTGREDGLGVYEALAEKIVQMAAWFERDPFIIDLGAGTCVQSVVLRGAGCPSPILCLDLFGAALDIGATLCRALKLRDIYFAQVDLSGADKGFSELKAAIKEHADRRPLVVISRYAIYPFYNAAEYTRLFNFLIDDLGVSAGLHLEMAGRFTPTFSEIQKQVTFPLQIPNKHRGKTDDPLAHLQGRSDIQTVEHVEIWPHYLNTHFPRFLSWRRKVD